MAKKRATTKSRARKGRAGPGPAASKAFASAIRSGHDQAAEVFARRTTQHRRRAAAVKKHVETARKKGPTEAALAEELLRRSSTGTLVAEGDSWFDYPFYDILKNLGDDYGYEVHTVAHRGDAVEIMAYGGGQLDDFARSLEQVLRSGIAPKAILLSGGGNDVAGDVFAMLINHKLSPNPGLNTTILEGVLTQRIRFAYATILSAVTQLCMRYLGRAVPVIVHGYGYPVPDGRGFFGGFGPLPGPWLEPGFRDKGYDDLVERIAIAAQLIDAFNDMLIALVAAPEFAQHVHYVDLRPQLSNNPSDYRKWWGNELHPSERGFDAVTKRFADTLGQLP